jgi:ketosteroid isomerase-like protein
VAVAGTLQTVVAAPAADVYLGEGSLAGRGVYANRAFAEGEVVVSYCLRRLSRRDYLALPEAKRLFVHSYWGERYLYPAPACYVNHADSPNTYQDFDQQSDIALRRIEPDELITTDARRDTDRELATFLSAYETAINTCDWQTLGRLIDDDAVLVGSGPASKAKMLETLAAADADTDDLRVSVGEAHWIIATGRWEAVCSYNVSVGTLSEPDARSRGHVTVVLKVIDGNWQIIYRHESIE